MTPIDPFNPRVQDSLVRRHATARTQTVRDTIDGFAYYPGILERLVRNYVALGDTSRAILLYEREVTNVVTAGMYQLLRPVLNDPGKALRLGVSTTELFENFEYVTRYGPRGNGSDLLKWCEPAACELIARDWTAAREPRLRQVGLLALFSRDPAVWSDTVIRIAAAGAHQLDDISRLARGVRFTRADEPELTLPSSSAAWDSWLDWMNGGNAMALARRDSAEIAAVGRRLLGSTASLLRNGSPNDLARFITIAEARHHVSYRDSIAVHFANATSDTARFVFGTLLHALNAPVRTTDALLMALQAPSALDRQLASAEIPRLTYAPADSVTSRAIEQTLLGALIDGTALWSRLDTPRAPGFGPRAITSRDSTFLFADSLTNASAAQLRAADITRYQSPWRFPAQASGREIRISAVNRAGPFARINVQYSDLVRLSDGRGGGFASGSTYYLVLIDGVWRLVSESSWVT